MPFCSKCKGHNVSSYEKLKEVMSVFCDNLKLNTNEDAKNKD